MTVGVFDGVHLGHRHLLLKLKAHAKERNKPSLAITFDFPPERALCPGKRFTGYITDYQQKVSLIEELGIDNLWVLSVARGVLGFTPEKFLTYINYYFPIQAMLVGNDFRFGVEAKAGIGELSAFSSKYGFELEVIPKKRFAGVLLSSSELKGLIKTAQFDKVKNFLGRDYLVKGEVKRGRGIGRQLGFPTANLDTFDYVLPEQGVYAALVKLGKRFFLSAVNIGKQGFECHLINFSKNILKEQLEVIFIKKIRAEIDFQSHQDLAKHIQKDIQIITSKYSTLSG